MTYRVTHPVLGSIFVDQFEYEHCIDFCKTNSIEYSIESDEYSKLLIV